VSVWQKTLLYLGLVDEDELEVEAAGRDRPAVPRQREPSSPQAQAEPRKIEPDGPSGASQPLVRPTKMRGPRRVEAPNMARRRTSTGGPPVAGVVVRPGDYSGDSASHAEIIAAHSFSDAKRLADMIRERIPVLVNLRDTEPEMVRRLVDFSSGLIYALDGTMRKVSEGVILVSPPRVALSPDEERRLSDLGLIDPAN